MRNYKQCQHRKIAIIGSEETGCRAIVCEQCGCPMTRRIIDGEYIYFARIEERYEQVRGWEVSA